MNASGQPLMLRTLQPHLQHTQKLTAWARKLLPQGNTPAPSTSSLHSQLIDDAVNVFSLKISTTLHSLKDDLPTALSIHFSQRIEQLYLIQALRLNEICVVGFRKALNQIVAINNCRYSSLSMQSFIDQFLSSYAAQTSCHFSTWRKRFVARVARYTDSSLPAHLKTTLPDRRPDFNQDHIPLLLQFFAINSYPSISERRRIADLSNMTIEQITNWFQNRRNRAKRDGLVLQRPDNTEAHRATDRLLINWAANDRADESDTDELSDDETVVDEESEAINAITSQQNPQSSSGLYPTNYDLHSGRTFPVECHFSCSPPSWVRHPFAPAAEQLSTPDFDELCRLFTGLCIDTKRSAKNRPREAALASRPAACRSKPWNFNLILCPGRHPAYLDPGRIDSRPHYSSSPPPPTKPQGKAGTHQHQRKAKTRSTRTKRLPSSTNIPHSSSPAHSPTRSISSKSLSTLGSPSREASIESDLTLFEGSATPPFPFFDASQLSNDGGELDVSFGPFNDNNFDELFGDENSLDQILRQLAQEDLQSAGCVGNDQISPFASISMVAPSSLALFS